MQQGYQTSKFCQNHKNISELHKIFLAIIWPWNILWNSLSLIKHKRTWFRRMLCVRHICPSQCIFNVIEWMSSLYTKIWLSYKFSHNIGHYFLCSVVINSKIVSTKWDLVWNSLKILTNVLISISYSCMTVHIMIIPSPKCGRIEWKVIVQLYLS